MHGKRYLTKGTLAQYSADPVEIARRRWRRIVIFEMEPHHFFEFLEIFCELCLLTELVVWQIVKAFLLRHGSFFGGLSENLWRAIILCLWNLGFLNSRASKNLGVSFNLFRHGAFGNG